MSNRKLVVIAAMTALLASAGCATVPPLPPPERTRTFDLTKDEAWSRVIEYFASASLPIRTIEKDSGVVYADNLILTGSQFQGWGWGRCGSPFFPSSTVTVSINVFVRPANDEATAVTVNTDYIHQFDGLFTGQRTMERCQSTGRLERMIFGQVESGQPR